MKQVIPYTKTIDFVENLHGVEIADPYRWLEEASSERSDWIKIQNDYANNRLKRIKGRSQIRSRLEELLMVDTVSAPSVREGRIFFYKHKANQQHNVIYMKDWVPNAEEQILLDPNQMSEDGSIAIYGTSIPKDGKIIAYGLTKHGSDWVNWKIMNIENKEILDKIPRLA